jgi:hypothetical protein
MVGSLKWSAYKHGRFFGLAVGLLTWSAYYGRLFQVGFLPVGF